MTGSIKVAEFYDPETTNIGKLTVSNWTTADELIVTANEKFEPMILSGSTSSGQRVHKPPIGTCFFAQLNFPPRYPLEHVLLVLCKVSIRRRQF